MNSEQNFFKNSTASLILSGGKSGRFPNHQKALLPFSSNTNFIEQIISVYIRSDIKRIQVVVQPEIVLPEKLIQQPEVSVCINHQPDLGRLYSIQCGLKNLKDEEFCFIQNVDSPFIDTQTILSLSKHCFDADCIVPTMDGKRGHPVLISKKIMEYILSIDDYELTLRDILEQFKKAEVKVEQPGILININTPEEYNHYFSKK